MRKRDLPISLASLLLLAAASAPTAAQITPPDEEMWRGGPCGRYYACIETEPLPGTTRWEGPRPAPAQSAAGKRPETGGAVAAPAPRSGRAPVRGSRS
jgi:hypothetical protein